MTISCIYKWDICKLNNTFIKNTESTKVKLININHYQLMEIISTKYCKKPNGIKTVLCYPQDGLNLKPNHNYKLEITGFSNINNCGQVYLWVRSKYNNVCYDLNECYQDLGKVSNMILTNFKFKTINNNRVWFGIYFNNSNPGDKFYLSSIKLYDLCYDICNKVCDDNYNKVCNDNCNIVSYDKPECSPCEIDDNPILYNNYYNRLPYYYNGYNHTHNGYNHTHNGYNHTHNGYNHNHYNTYPINNCITYSPKYNHITDTYGLYTQCNTHCCNLVSNNSNDCDTHCCNLVSSNSKDCDTHCEEHFSNSVNNCNSAGNYCNNDKHCDTTKIYPPGINKICIYSIDISTTNQLDNMDKYQKLVYLDYTNNYEINITTTPMSITGYIFLIGDVYLKWVYDNTATKGLFEYGNSVLNIKTTQIYDLNTSYAISIINSTNNTSNIQLIINGVTVINNNQIINICKSGYISLFSKSHNALIDKYIGKIDALKLYNVVS